MTDEPFDFTPDTATTAWSIVATVSGVIATVTLIAAVVLA